MKDGIECVMKSVGEPQLKKGIPAVHNQTVPFTKFTHVDGICPESDAINKLLNQLEYKWSLWLDGDMILYKNAHEIVRKITDIETKKRSNITEIKFGLYDPFLDMDICCCILKHSEFTKQFGSDNVLNNDGTFVKKAKKHGRVSVGGWKNNIVGTHFADPTDEQVFARFYSRGVKDVIGHSKGPYKHLDIMLDRKYNNTKNSQFKIASEGFKLGLKLGHYPTSHNIDFDMELYDKWKNGKL